MDATNNIATDLFYKVRSRFSGLKLGAETGEITINPEQARFFDFDYTEGQTPIGHVSISLAEPNSIKVYFSNGITEGMDDGQKTNWYGFLKELRQFAKRRLLSFDTRDIAKDNLDKRDYQFLSQNAQPKPQTNMVQKPVGESMMSENMMSESSMYGSKTVSYQKLMDTRLIIKHNQAVMDDTQPGARTRNISALFVENQDGERFKYPFIHLAGARAMQRHVANSGLPYDDLGKSITQMSEEIAQLKSFGNYVVRNDLMNSETNSVVERSTDYLNHLREQIKAISKQSHYEAYRESFQANSNEEIPQDVVEDFKQKFTVRSFKEDIATVFPVLYRLMKEGNTIGYDDIVAMTQQEINNEDLEVETTEDSDPFAQFENWVMGLGEESGVTSDDPEAQAAAIQGLQELIGQAFSAGVDGTNAIESLKDLIEDPELFKRIKEQATEDPEADVRPQIQAWLELNAPEALEQLDFGDMVIDPEAAQGGDQPAPEAEPAPADPAAAAAPAEEPVPQESMQTNGPNKSDVPAYLRKQKGDDPMTLKDLEDEKTKSPTSSAGLARRKKELGMGEADTEPSKKDDDDNSPPWDTDDNEKSPFKKPNNPNRTGRDSAKALAQKGMQSKMNVQELAEFIHSFYDKDSGTFPKGPEGVAIMVGKKFGEQAEMVARKMVERMAPQQQDPQIAELARIRELAGTTAPVSEDLQADDGQAYDDEADFFGQFEADHFDDTQESEDGMEIRGYIDGVNVMAWRFDDESKTSGYGNYDDSTLGQEESSELTRIRELSGISQGIRM
jgi:hypothetical protein